LALTLLASPALAGVKAVIDKSTQQMQVWEGDTLLYTWPASTGKKSSYTPTGTFHPYKVSAGKHRSSKYGASMIDSVYYKGTRAIHGVDEPESVALLGVKGSSMGCTHLSAANAKIFYTLVQKHGFSGVTIVIQE
jgi:hypothetical protein